MGGDDVVSIKRIIAQSAEIREVTVEFGGETYKLQGRPDARTLKMSMGRGGDELDKMVTHLRRVTGIEDLAVDDVLEISLIQSALCHEDDESKRYDITEIAQLYAKDGGLYLHLMKAASEVVGLLPKDGERLGDSIITMALGEQQGGATDTSSSSLPSSSESPSPSSSGKAGRSKTSS